MPAGPWANVPPGEAGPAGGAIPAGAWANVPPGETGPAGGATPPNACPEGGC